MADKNTISTGIVLTGEAEYKKSLDNINRALRESKSAMKAAAAEYDGASDSMVAMYREGDALERHLENQKEALRLMTEQLDKVERAYGRNSREATELRTRINNMRTEMARTQTEIRQFENRMEQAGNAMQGIDSDTQKAGDAIAKLGDDAQRADGGAEQLLETLTKLTGLNLGKLSLAGAGAAAAAGVKYGMENAEEQTDARGHMAAYTGKTGEELAGLEESAKDVYRQGYGDDLMDAAQGLATLHSYTGIIGDDLENATQIAFRMRDVFGHDIPESARTAQQMMAVFGISAQEAYGLMAAGAQEGADKNGNLLDTINEYAPYYEKAGKSAEAFMGTLTAGAEHGVYDIDKIGDAMKEFTIRLTDGSEATKEALKSLGVETMDLPSKFAMGGETASAAFDLVIDKLQAIEDPLTRSQTGIALFGTQWEDTGGAILQIFDAIDSGSTDARAALDALDATRLDDLGEGLERVGRHVETAAGELFAPFTKGAAHAVHGVADALDEMEAKADEAQKRAEEAEAAAVEATRDLYAELDAINAQIREADISGDMYGAAKLMEQRERLLDEIAQTTAEIETAYEEMGATGAAALERKAPDMQAAMRAVTDEAVRAVEDAQPDMEREAETLGDEGVYGLADALRGMEDAAADAVDGAVAELNAGSSRAYAAGQAMGSAFVRGYKNKLLIYSPSLVMQEAAEDTTSPLFDRFEEDEARLYAAGEALGAAVASGYGSNAGMGAAPAWGGVAASGGASQDVIAAAMREALVGLAWETDVGTFARLVEPGVSAATTQRAQATVRGQSAQTKRW